MPEKFNIFAEVSPEHLFAYIDCLASGEARAKALEDPFSQKVAFLQEEIKACRQRLETLEGERAELLRLAKLAGTAGNDLRQSLETAKVRVPAWPEYAAARDLNRNLLWLAGKFRLSRSFPPLEDGKLPLLPPAKIGEEIRPLYFARLGLESLEPVGSAIKAYERARASLARNAREIFPAGRDFALYFEKVEECLGAAEDIPAKVLQELENAAESALALAADRSGAWFAPPDNGSWNFTALVKDCNHAGDKLASELVRANQRLEAVFALAAAIFPDADYSEMAAFYRPQGNGDPEIKKGALWRFIQNTNI